MILYRDRLSATRVGPPAWLEGAPELQCREDAGGRLWGIGDPLLVGPQPDGAWKDLDDGWQCAFVGATDPRDLARQQRWADLAPVTGVNDLVWLAPEILTPTGEIAYRPPLGGPDFLPMPTPGQKRCQEVAQAARVAMTVAATGGEGVPRAAACRWAAILLSETHHVAAGVFEHGLMDETLAIATTLFAAGLRPEPAWR